MNEETADGTKWGQTVLTNGDIRLKVCRHGPMFYNIHDVYIGRSLEFYGEYSEAECAIFSQIVQSGQVALDIGANIGTHTIFLARAVGEQGRVYAIDPQQVVFQTLCANVVVNNLRNVETVHAAVGREAGTVMVPRPDYGQETNFGGISLIEAGGEAVRMIRVDDLALPACHFMKIDVEGYERDVLLGAQKTIDAFRPILYVENDRKDQSPALLQSLLDMDYRVYWHLPPLFNPSNFFGNGENLFGPVVSANVLCLPSEMNQQLSGYSEITSPEQWFMDDMG